MDSLLYKKLEGYIMDIILQNASVPNFKLPSERALSLKFDTSREPIRRAYENLIQKGYVKNIHGKGYYIDSNAIFSSLITANQKAARFSLIIPSVTSHYNHDILSGISDFCISHHIELSILISDNNSEKEDTLLHSAAASGAKGIILFPADHNHACAMELLKLSLRKYPLVLIDRTLPAIHASFVSSENHQAMVNAVEFLQKKEYKKIVYITSPPELSSATDARINGFTHGLLRYYKTAEPRNILMLNGMVQQTKDTIIRYFKKYPDTQVVIFTGPMLQVMLTAVRELGLHIPRDLRFMIFDDELSHNEYELLKPYIIKQDGYRIGYYAAESLYNQLYGDLQPTTKMLPVTITDSDKTEA